MAQVGQSTNSFCESCSKQHYDNDNADDSLGGQRNHGEGHFAVKELYGRRREHDELERAYRRKCLQGHADREIILVTGPSGVGKSELARSLERTVIDADGYFIAGKCDQLHRTEPFFPFVSAALQLVNSVIDKGEDAADSSRQKVAEATCGDSEVLIDMMPAFGKLFNVMYNSTRSLEQLARNRRRPLAGNPSIRAFCSFMRLFCSTRQPFVCLLDDIQWMDLSSLRLMKALATDPQIEGFVMLCTCRDNEVTIDDPLSETLRDLEARDVTITEIRLENLGSEAIHEMIVGTLSLSAEDSKSLSDITYRQTRGNVFFAREFLNECHEKRLIFFDERQRWVMDKSRAKDCELSRDCDRLLARAIDHLGRHSESVKEVLRISSCLGTVFQFDHVRYVAQAHVNEVNWALSKAVERGFLLKQGKVFRWAHDRFKEAAYVLIPEGDKKAFHIAIGRRLLQFLPQSALEESVFVVLNQFWIGIELLDDQATKDRLAELCLFGGGKAAMSSAFDVAARYFCCGIDLLDADHWTKQYELSLALFNSAAEMKCTTGQLDSSDEYVSEVLTKARTLEDKLRAYETKIYSLGTRQHFEEAIKVGFRVLRELGEPLPRQARYVNIILSVLNTKRSLTKQSEYDFLNLRPLRDWRKLAAMRIIHLLYPPVSRTKAQFSPLLSTRSIRITLRDGTCATSSVGVMTFGLILCHPLGYVEEGIQIADTALRIIEKYNAVELMCRALLCIHGFTKPWKQPLRNSLEPLMVAARYGRATGDIEMECLSLLVYSHFQLFSGLPLNKIVNEMGDYLRLCRDRQQDTVGLYMAASLQMALNFCSPSSNPMVLEGEVFEETLALEKSIESGNDSGLGIILTMKCFLAVYLGDFVAARKISLLSRKVNKDAFNPSLMFHVHFLDGIAEVVDTRRHVSRMGRLLAGRRSLAKLKVYARYCPENVLNKIYMIEAEKNILYGQFEQARKKYDLSIEQSHLQGSIMEEALAQERAGIMFEDLGKKPEALQYLERARANYERWGSPIKVEDLSKRIAFLKENVNVGWVVKTSIKQVG